jgi:hypothetical protein
MIFCLQNLGYTHIHGIYRLGVTRTGDVALSQFMINRKIGGQGNPISFIRVTRGVSGHAILAMAGCSGFRTGPDTRQR